MVNSVTVLFWTDLFSLSLISSFTLTLNRKFYHAWAPEKPCILQVFLPAFCLQIQRKKHELSSPCHSEGPKANYLRSLAFFLMPSSESWTLLLDSHIEYCCNCYYYHCLLIRFIVITSTISIIIIVIVLIRIPILYYHYILSWFLLSNHIHIFLWFLIKQGTKKKSWLGVHHSLFTRAQPAPKTAK